MMDEIGPLPFELSRTDLALVRLTYASFSAKTGAGKSEITLSGTGTVKLLQESGSDDPHPAVIEQSLPLPIFARILDLMEEENFFALEELYRRTGPTPTGTLVIELTLPERSKKVMVEQPASCPAFDRIAGAIKMGVGLVLPAALQNRFFPGF
jgi:hypothetical protein